jgi:hypothetical protein
MKEVHNIHNHKIKTVEGYWVLPGQTIYVDDEGKKCKKPEEKVDNGLQERVEELEKNTASNNDTSISDKLADLRKQVMPRKVQLDHKVESAFPSGTRISYTIPTNVSKAGFANYSDFEGEGIISIVENWNVSHPGGGAGGYRSHSFYYTLYTGSSFSSVIFPLFDNSDGGYSITLNPGYITIKSPPSKKDGNTSFSNSVSAVYLTKL